MTEQEPGLIDSATEPRQSAVAALPAAWSIGIFAGRSPLTLQSAPRTSNPVISAESLPASMGEFVADPFMIRARQGWLMFFEVLSKSRQKGEIAVAESEDAVSWRYRGMVLSEQFHLSYPCVFESEGDYYLVPETLDANEVRIYRASRFPEGWSVAGVLLRGRHADPTLFRSGMNWWMFTCCPVRASDTLRLYYASDLMGPWIEHPASPLIEGDCRKARPAGRVINWNGRLIRFAQDCYPRYGSAVRAFEILKLSETEYTEREACAGPVLCGGQLGWCGNGMHHLDAHELDDGSWLACVDGR